MKKITLAILVIFGLALVGCSNPADGSSATPVMNEYLEAIQGTWKANDPSKPTMSFTFSGNNFTYKRSDKGTFTGKVEITKTELKLIVNNEVVRSWPDWRIDSNVLLITGGTGEILTYLSSYYYK